MYSSIRPSIQLGLLTAPSLDNRSSLLHATTTPSCPPCKSFASNSNYSPTPPPPISVRCMPRANPFRHQDEYLILNSKHVIGIHGFVLVYSVTSRKSFEMIQIIYDKIVNFCGTSLIPCAPRTTSPKGSAPLFSPSWLSCANSYSYRTLRQVTPDEGQGLAAENHAIWVGTIAKKNLNVGTSHPSLALGLAPLTLSGGPGQHIVGLLVYPSQSLSHVHADIVWAYSHPQIQLVQVCAFLSSHVLVLVHYCFQQSTVQQNTSFHACASVYSKIIPLSTTPSANFSTEENRVLCP